MRGFGRSLAALLVLSGAFFAAREADACGGTFCDSGPNTMPVDQTGENILFVMNGTEVEAHIQIQYKGEAARFAWVIPLPEVPELEIGSQPLFVSLLNGSVPRYGFRTGFCGRGGPGPPVEGGGGTGTDNTVETEKGPQVVAKKTVGAFEVTVLKGGTAQEVSDWLQANGYQSIPTAPALLASYVAQGFVFAAIKLQGGAGVDEIHPLVVRYPGNEPCVPLKLTAVAAVEDMGVRAFFLGSGRVVPTNYMHVELNPARLDFSTFADNYDDVVSRAMDSAVVNGRGFVTEYAGPSSVVVRSGIYSQNWRAAAFVGLDPTQVIDELVKQGLAKCGGAECTFSHPLLVSMLHEHLPVPMGVDENAFYSCLPCYTDRIDRVAWTETGFAIDFQERIVVPGRRADDLLDANPYLTRLFTLLSPAEMTVDPIFHQRADLAEVTAQRIATRMVAAGVGFTVPGGRMVALTPDGAWPEFDSHMPWVERVEEIQQTGNPIVLVNNKTLIDLLVEDSNKVQGWDENACRPPTTGGTGGTSGTGGGAGRAGSSGSSGTGNPSVTDETDVSGGGGCGCATPRSASRSWLGLLPAFLYFAVRRTRRAIRTS